MRRVLAAAVGLAMAMAGLAGTADAAVPQARAVDDSCPTDAVPEDGFADVPPGAPHEDTVDCVVWWQIARGLTDSSYGPSHVVNRAQMASFIARLVDAADGKALPSQAPNAFGDDDGSEWTAHHDNINRLAAAGIVGGRSDGTYGPGAGVNRAQMATFLVRAYEYTAETTLPATDDWFADDEDATAHEGNIDKAAEAGFTGGRADGTYGPDDPVRRDQMASFLARMLDLLVEEHLAVPPTPDQNPTGRVTVLHAVPSGAQPVAGIEAAIRHEIGLVDEWLRGETGGLGLAWVRSSGGEVEVAVVSLDVSRAEIEAAPEPLGALVASLQRAGYADTDSIHAVYVDVDGGPCGITGSGYSVLWMPSCGIYPDAATPSFPYGGTYLVAHELTHALGAVPACAPHEGNGAHVTDDPRDVLYAGTEPRDWEHQMLDPGHDDYFRHDIPGCPDIADAPFWIT